MSRSRKKHPSMSWVCYSSNKKSKQNANRVFRHTNKQIIRSAMSYDKLIEEYWTDEYDLEEYDFWPIETLCDSNFKKIREVSNTYDFASDGLPTVFSLHRPIVDWTDKNYTWGKRGEAKLTSLAEAIKNHHYKLYKNYINK